MVLALIDRTADALSRVALWVAALATLVMVGITLYEVVARYAFNAPTIWASTLAWMLNGTGFMLGAAYTLRIGQHVAIDVFSKAIPTRTRAAIHAAILLLLFVPAVYFLADAAWDQTIRAYERGAVERVSPWKPLIWPFYAVLAAALSALIFETLAQILRLIRTVLTGAAEAPADDMAAEVGTHG